MESRYNPPADKVVGARLQPPIVPDVLVIDPRNVAAPVVPSIEKVVTFDLLRPTIPFGEIFISPETPAEYVPICNAPEAPKVNPSSICFDAVDSLALTTSLIRLPAELIAPARTLAVRPPMVEVPSTEDPLITAPAQVKIPACVIVTVGNPVGPELNEVLPLDNVVVFPPAVADKFVGPINQPPIVPLVAVIVPVIANVDPFQVILLPEAEPTKNLYPAGELVSYPSQKPVPTLYPVAPPRIKFVDPIVIFPTVIPPVVPSVVTVGLVNVKALLICCICVFILNST